MEGDEAEQAEEDVVQKQRLKAAMHYTVGRVCEEVEETTFSRELIAAIAETAYKQCELLAADLEQFAKHAHRTTVNGDDVKLCCRRSPSLLEYITAQSKKLKAEREQEAGKTGGKRKAGRKGEREAGPSAMEEEDGS